MTLLPPMEVTLFTLSPYRMILEVDCCQGSRSALEAPTPTKKPHHPHYVGGGTSTTCRVVGEASNTRNDTP